MPTVLFPYELTMEVPTEHLFSMYNFLSKLKCRWKFPPTFSLTVKMSLEISTDIFSVTAKMSMEISTDIFSHSQSAAENFHRHFFPSQLKCRWKFHQHFSPTAKCLWKFPKTFSFTSRKYQWKFFSDKSQFLPQSFNFGKK